MRRVGPGLAVAIAATLLVGAAPAAASLDLIGTWHVLVHYKDSASNNPDFERWEDRVWVFAMEGSRLRWTQYPLVVFEDKTGRFEKLGTNRASRVFHYWEPNAAQQANIQAGLEINERGSQTKTLRGSPQQGWKSGTPIRSFSVNTLTYTQIWSIEDPTGLPAFRFEETLGGARAESVEGITDYRTTRVENGADALSGTFTRDDSRTGTFRMVRAGDVSQVRGSGKSDSERFFEMFAGQLGSEAEGVGALLSAAKEPDALSKEDRTAVRARVRELLERAAQERGMDPRYFSAEINDMTDQVMREWERGKSPQQIERMIREGKITPRILQPMR